MMQLAFDSLSLGLGAVFGGFVVWLAARSTHLRARAHDAAIRAELAARLAMMERREVEWRDSERDHTRTIARLQADLAGARARHAELATTLSKERLSAAEKLAVVEKAQAALADSFKALSSEALRANNESFLHLARETLSGFQEQAKGELERRHAAFAAVVAPVRDSLDRMDGQIQAMEQARAGAYEGLRQQVIALMDSQSQLRAETGALVRALRTPAARGRWGEIQLRRVVEIAGMLDHCDFTEQTTVESREGARLRPDMVVRLPGGKTIVVDAKTPLDAYLDGIETGDDTARAQALARHARHVRDHMKQLGAKAYWDQFPDTPEFVVLFLPGENFFSAALEHDPALIEAGMGHRVVLATPTTLIALLRAVAYGWRQEKLTENARDISALGAEIYKRLSDLGAHMARLGAQLDKAVTSYNGAVGSLESRVLVTARRFRDLHAVAGDEPLPVLEPLERTTRPLQSLEMQPAEESPPASSGGCS